MKTQLLYVPLVGLIAAFVFFARTATVQAADPSPAVQAIFEKLIGAIKTNNRNAFAAVGTEEVKQGMTREAMDGLSKGLGPRLQEGYEAIYLCQLKQAGHQAHLWKLSFKDRGDDIVVRIVLEAGKVSGFFLQ